MQKTNKKQTTPKMPRIDPKYEKELLIRAKKEDQEAFEELCKWYDPLLKSRAMKSYRGFEHQASFDDFYSEAMVGFVKAVVNYNLKDENNNTPFCAYAKTCVSRKLVSYWRKLTSKKSQINTSSSANARELLDQIADTGDIQADFVDGESLKILLSKYKAILSKYELSILKLEAEGYQLKDIAKELGKNPKSVYNAKFRIKSKISDKDTINQLLSFGYV